MDFEGWRSAWSVEFEIYREKSKYKSEPGEKEDSTGTATLLHLRDAVTQVETDQGLRPTE